MNCKNCRANCTGAKHDREIAMCLGYDPPKTNADRIRAMSDEEIEDWYWWIHKEMMRYTDSRDFVYNWLRQEAEEGE